MDIEKITILLIKRIFYILVIRPFLYTRWSWMLIIPLMLYWSLTIYAIFVYYLFYVIIYYFFMGYLGGYSFLTEQIIWSFGIKYEIIFDKNDYLKIGASVYNSRELEVNDKKYKITFAVMGGKVQEESIHIKRAAIYYWFMR